MGLSVRHNEVHYSENASYFTSMVLECVVPIVRPETNPTSLPKDRAVHAYFMNIPA